MIEVRRYGAGDAAAWDEFIGRSKNGVFLFLRGYMDYHADRFTDHSLMFYKGGRLVGVMPADEAGGRLRSHGGLTFGGVVGDSSMTTPLMLKVFDAMLAYLRQNGVSRLLYKAVPHTYHMLPAEEDRYALFMHDAKLFRRDVTTTIRMRSMLPFQERRRRAVRKALNAGLAVSRSHDFGRFMEIVHEVLQARYQATPVHTAAEITHLAGVFPDNIKLFAAVDRQGEMLAGVMIYEHREIAHVQYIAATEAGRQAGAVDLVFDRLIHEYYIEKSYFDFGISNEKEGRYLNVGLIEQKEGFGARAVVHDFFDLPVDGRGR